MQEEQTKVQNSRNLGALRVERRIFKDHTGFLLGEETALMSSFSPCPNTKKRPNQNPAKLCLSYCSLVAETKYSTSKVKEEMII